MSIELFKTWIYGQTDYIDRLIEVTSDVETYLNQIFGQLTGQSGALAVPLGLQEIFDRRGEVGSGAYLFADGVLTGPAYNFTVVPGAYWSGTTFYRKATQTILSMAGKSTGTYYLNLDSSGTPLVSSTSNTTTIRQFDWNSSSHTISNEALYAGVAVLFDGDDYAYMLTSTARAKTFSRVADRLEEIEVLLGKTVQTPASANTININWALGGIARVTLDRATTTFNFSGAYDGQKLVLELLQDGVGGRAVAFGAESVAGTDFTFPVPLTVDPDKRDFVGFIYSLATGKYNYVSLARGYSA